MQSQTDHAKPPAETLGEIPLASLRPSPTNPRKHFDAREIADLAVSIKAHGLLQRILVRPLPDSSGNEPILTTDGRWHHVGYWEIVAGERRYRALLKLGAATAPVVVRQLSDAEVLQVQLIENLQRVDVSAIEFARGIQRLRNEGHGGARPMTLQQIAKAIGKSEAAVRGALLLVDDSNPPDLVLAIEKGLISPSVAELICRLPEGKRAKATEMLLPETDADPVGVRRAKEMLERRFGEKPTPAERARKEAAKQPSIDELGLTRKQLQAAYLAPMEFGSGDKPTEVATVEIEGRAHVVIGSRKFNHGTTVYLVPLMPVRLKPIAKAEQRDYYTGLLVESNGQQYAVCERTEEIAVFAPIEEEKPKKTGKSKDAPAPKTQASAVQITKPASDEHAAWRVGGIEGRGIPTNVERFLRSEGVESIGQLADALESGRFQTSMSAANREKLIAAVEDAQADDQVED